MSTLPISQIKIGENRRPLSDVGRLQESISHLGLLNPITITAENILVAGLHRLEACKRLGWMSIPVQVVTMDVLKAELAEIDENLIRNELSVMDRGDQLKRRKEIYEAMFPESKKDVRGGFAKAAKSASADSASAPAQTFTADTAAKTGKSQRVIQEEIQIAEKIDPEVKEALRGSETANSKTELLELSRKPVTEQRKIAAKITTGKSKSVREAIKDEKKSVRIAEINRQKEEISKTSPLAPAGLFHVISIDPPWPYRDGIEQPDYDPEGHRASNPYPEMSLEEIKSISLPAATDCVLWLWTTHKFMRHSFEILDGWGFRDRAILTWAKDRMGLGRWLRSQSEFCIMATKGNPVISLTNQTTILNGPMREHSRKPDEFFKMVDCLCHGRKLEYFSREKRAGWEVFGNDTDKF